MDNDLTRASLYTGVDAIADRGRRELHMRNAYDAAGLPSADPFGHLFEQKIGLRTTAAVVDQKDRRSARVRAVLLRPLHHVPFVGLAQATLGEHHQ